MSYIATYLEEVVQICRSIDQNSIESLAQAIKELKSRGGRLFFLGVGGSAGNASHATNDFRKILNIETYAVSDNVSELTARINDDGWDTCFSNWLKVSKLSKNDAIFILSVGGGSATTSQNLVKSMTLAKETGASIYSIVSRDGGAAKSLSDHCVMIPVVNEQAITPHAEEWQAIIWHLLVNYLAKHNDKRHS